MRKGLTEHIEAIIEKVAELECIKPYVLVGGTALAMQIGHRKSEDLDFMMWRKSITEKPEVAWNLIERELKHKFGKIDGFNLLGFDQVEFTIEDVRISFFVSDNHCPVLEYIPYLGNIRLADVYSIMAMKLEVMLRRMKMRDYYDIYSILLENYDLAKGIDLALKYSHHKLKTKNIVMMLSSNKFIPDASFEQLEPLYHATLHEMRDYILQKLEV